MKNSNQAFSGESLVACFLTAITNLSTTETAKLVAEQSERDTIQNIEIVSGGGYVKPQDIPPESQESLVKSSVDAHIKKAQAQHLSSFTTAQISLMEQDAKQNYCGKKVQVIVLDPSVQPVESYWFNDKTGEYTTGVIKARAVKGKIEDISLSKNVLVLRPGLISKILLPARKYYGVYVINPSTLTPAVQLALV